MCDQAQPRVTVVGFHPVAREGGCRGRKGLHQARKASSLLSTSLGSARCTASAELSSDSDDFEAHADLGVAVEGVGSGSPWGRSSQPIDIPSPRSKQERAWQLTRNYIAARKAARAAACL